MEACEFLETAKRLLDGSPTEADWRTSINRSYYGVFVTLAVLLKSRISKADRELRLGDDPMHKPTIDSLKNASGERVRQIGKLLESLSSARCRADYHPNKQVTLKAARTEFENATDLLDDVRSEQDPIVLNVKEYLAKFRSGPRTKTT